MTVGMRKQSSSQMRNSFQKKQRDSLLQVQLKIKDLRIVRAKKLVAAQKTPVLNTIKRMQGSKTNRGQSNL